MFTLPTQKGMMRTLVAYWHPPMLIDYCKVVFLDQFPLSLRPCMLAFLTPKTLYNA
jgi:hypothetical protein